MEVVVNGVEKLHTPRKPGYDHKRNKIRDPNSKRSQRRDDDAEEEKAKQYGANPSPKGGGKGDAYLSTVKGALFPTLLDKNLLTRWNKSKTTNGRSRAMFPVSSYRRNDIQSRFGKS